MKTVKSRIIPRACAWSLIVSIFLISACDPEEEGKVPPEYLPQEKMVDVLVDVHIVEGAKVGRKIMGDTLLADIYFLKVYEKHNITKDEFSENFEWYTAHPEIMNEVYEAVLDSLNKVDLSDLKNPATEPVDKENLKERLRRSIAAPDTVKE